MRPFYAVRLVGIFLQGIGRFAGCGVKARRIGCVHVARNTGLAGGNAGIPVQATRSSSDEAFHRDAEITGSVVVVGRIGASHGQGRHHLPVQMLLDIFVPIVQ